MSRLVPLVLAALTAAFLAPASASAVQPPAPAPDLSAPLIRGAQTPPTTLPTVWGCRPGKVPNPCLEDGETTILRSTHLQPRVVDHVEPAPQPSDPPIDCFYVYGSVTAASGATAPRHTERSVDDTLRWQAGRFSRTCRVYAPIYRQLSAVVGIGGEMAQARTTTSRAQNTAFSDLLGAWRDYMAHDNHGRGVLLIGHSQGAAFLIRLMEREIDRNAEMRKKLVGAFLVGGNFAVKPGKRVGGTFAYVPTCAVPGEYGCVVTYSAFTAAPGGTALFGRLGPLNKAFGGPYGSTYAPACTNPAELAGQGDALKPVLRGAPPGGGEGDTDVQFWNDRRPRATTAWVVPGDQYTGRCRITPTTAALIVKHGPASADPPSMPWSDWGLHVREVQLTLGNLERIAQLQSSAWLADHPS